MADALFDDVLKSAVISDCGTYRYELLRRWDVTKPRVGWVMLNPSTADAEVDDPTIRRCMGFARAWGYGGIVVRNLYALRATDPRELWKHPDPIGPDNRAHLREAGRDALTICAWGSNAHPFHASAAIVGLIRAGGRPHYLALTKGGQPRHPLYLKADLTPIPFGEDPDA